MTPYSFDQRYKSIAFSISNFPKFFACKLWSPGLAPSQESHEFCTLLSGERIWNNNLDQWVNAHQSVIFLRQIIDDKPQQRESKLVFSQIKCIVPSGCSYLGTWLMCSTTKADKRSLSNSSSVLLDTDSSLCSFSQMKYCYLIKRFLKLWKL